MSVIKHDTRTIDELAREAIAVQDACNLSGVVHGWSLAMSRLYELLRASPDFSGTDQVNRHPINQLWASKVHDLTDMGGSDTMRYIQALDACEVLAGKVV